MVPLLSGVLSGVRFPVCLIGVLPGACLMFLVFKGAAIGELLDAVRVVFLMVFC